MVRADSSSQRALEELCQAYWYPVYAYVRRRVENVHEAQDLTQAFFERLLEKQAIVAADPSRGRFRAFLLTACKRFLINEWHKGRAQKRGGGKSAVVFGFEKGESRYALEATDTLTPERLFEQQWAITLLAHVLERLRQEYADKGKGRLFDELKQFLSGPSRRASHAAAAESLGMSEGAVKVAAHRLRVRYRELLRQEIAQTVSGPEEIDEEIRSLFSLLGAEKSQKI